MSKRMILCRFMMLAIVLTSLPGAQAQTFISRERGDERRPRPVLISSYQDDPFVRESLIRRMNPERFDTGENERRILSGDLVTLSEESKIYRKDQKDDVFKPFAWNPWPQMTTSNAAGNFIFPDEERFPLHRVERDANGRIVLKDGLQVWLPQILYLGNTTTFEAAHAVKDAAEFWAGRDILWGQNGVLDIEPHAFIDFNAFFSVNTRTLHFGVVPYRLPGQTDIKIFETATSWEMVAHECGHAIEQVLKPNQSLDDQETKAWFESFADQMGMWASLRNPNRVFRVMAETNGDLNQSNAITRMGESFAALTGKGTGIRDAFNDLKVSDTSEQIHDRSQVLTGAVYKFFLTIYNELKRELAAEEALRQAGQILGFFQMRATDYTPENQVTLEDVAKAYLKMDKEFFGSRYHNVLVDEFTRREIFDANSEHEWLVHEDSMPYLWLSRQSSDQDVEELLQANALLLGIGQDFGLKLQSVIREEFRGQTIVRAQLTLGRGEIAQPLDNHAILVFRADGLLADYHPPLQPYPSLQGGQVGQARTLMQARETVQLRRLISQAKRLRLDERGAPLSIVRKPDGQLTVEVRVMRGEGLNAYMEVFSLDNPRGERREIIIPPVPPNQRIPIPDDVLN